MFLCEGSFLYKYSPFLTGFNTSPSSLRIQPRLKGVADASCKCEHSAKVSPGEIQQSQVIMLSLLVADTPASARAFPSKKMGIAEVAKSLVLHCVRWKDSANRNTTAFMNQTTIANGSLILLSQAEFAAEPFMADRLSVRALELINQRPGIDRHLDLGFSWPAAASEYPSYLPQAQVRVKARPQWPLELRTNDLVLLEGMVEACHNFLIGTSYVWPGPQERKASFGTFVSCQL